MSIPRRTGETPPNWKTIIRFERVYLLIVPRCFEMTHSTSRSQDRSIDVNHFLTPYTHPLYAEYMWVESSSYCFVCKQDSSKVEEKPNTLITCDTNYADLTCRFSTESLISRKKTVQVRQTVGHIDHLRYGISIVTTCVTTATSIQTHIISLSGSYYTTFSKTATRCAAKKFQHRGHQRNTMLYYPAPFVLLEKNSPRCFERS